MTSTALYQIRCSLFADISTNTQGAGFSILRDNANLSLIKTHFIRCTTSSSSGGGGFYAKTHSIEELCVIFDGCRAPNDGSSFLIASVCVNTTIEFTLMTNEFDFDQDSFIRFGKLYDMCKSSNATHVLGGDYIFSDYPESSTPSSYKYFNVVNAEAVNIGLFDTCGDLDIRFSNIINCSSGGSFLCNFAKAGHTFSLTNSVITSSNFKKLLDNTKPNFDINNNVYSTESLLILFGENTGYTTSIPSTLFFKYKSCNLEITFERNTEKIILPLIINILSK